MYSELDWFRFVDWAILRILGIEDGLELTASNIARNIDYNRQYTSARLQLLVEAGLLNVDKNGYPFYSLSDLGRRAAEREISADRLDRAVDVDPEKWEF